MHRLALALEFERQTKFIRSIQQLENALGEVSDAMGFRYFALVHHDDTLEGHGRALRVHNYPLSFSSWFDRNKLGRRDPVHRASHQTMRGFSWTRVPDMIRLGSADLDIFQRARAEGIGNGFTVPAHVPGESRGSCSFAVGADDQMADDWLPIAQLIGVNAFETARAIHLRGRGGTGQPLCLTRRQRDCVILAARGKTDGEIAGILGLSRETVRQHLKQARERYGIQTRAELAVRALHDGVITFNEVLDP
jgi:LuxR family quorum-sensing system transcriptional regulator CciR